MIAVYNCVTLRWASGVLVVRSGLWFLVMVWILWIWCFDFSLLARFWFSTVCGFGWFAGWCCLGWWVGCFGVYSVVTVLWCGLVILFVDLLCHLLRFGFWC